MDIQLLFDSLWSTLGGSLPTIAGSIAILAVGWLLAVATRALLNRALAVAFALAFGLGGRDSAGRQIDGWIKRLGSTEQGNR